MALISLVGPHAIGKTTAIQRWAKRYHKLTAISCDLGLVYNFHNKQKEKGWQGSAEEKRALVQKWQKWNGVVVIESARTDIIRFMEGEGHLILVTCNWELHEMNMRERCAAKNKKFREDYWTEGKLVYESCGRYLNSAEKNMPHHDLFPIWNKQTDWQSVDARFGELFRRYHNKSARRI